MIQQIAVFAYMSLVYLVAQYKKDNSIVDIAWGPGFLALVCIPFKSLRETVLVIAVVLWAIRLSAHIAQRHKGEDFRYQKMRKGWKYPRLEAFFKVFMLQGALICIVGLPLSLVHSSSLGYTWVECLGLTIFIFGFIYEITADYQLSKRTKKVHTKGLWELSRHPNYFGEIVLWWGIGIYAVRDSYVALLGPLVLTLIIRYVTMPMLEAKYKNNKEYQKYKKNTPAIIPWK